MKFRSKTILGVALIEGVLLSVLGLGVFHQLQAANEDELQRRAAITGRLLGASVRDAVISYDLATLQSVVADTVATGEVAYVRVLDPQQRLLAQGGVVPTGAFAADQNVSSIQDGVFDSEVGVALAGQAFGRIQFGIDVTKMQAQMARTRHWAIAISLLEMLLVAAFSFVLGTYLTRQLRSLRDASQTIARGDFSYRVVDSGNDEMAETAAAFNQMAASLKAEKAAREVDALQLQRQLSALNALNEVAALGGLEPQAILRKALALACELLQLNFGIISQIQGDDYRIVVQISPADTLEDNQHFALGITYCSTTLEHGDLLVVPDAQKSEYQGHPCFRAFGLATYAGIPLWVRGELFGTLSFSSVTPRLQGFDEFECTFIRLLARWASAFLERMQSLQDVQRSQLQLEEKRQELQSILDSSSVGITFVRDRRQVWANKRMAEIFGYSAEEMAEQNTRMFYVSEQAYEELGRQGYASLQRGEPYATEQVMQCKDGRHLWMRISGRLVAPGEPAYGSIWVFEDITERQQSEQQLRIAATAFEAQEGMVVTDAANRILRVNRAFTEITGYASEDAVGQPISLLKSGHHDAAFYAQMWQSLHASGAWQGEIWNRRKNGEVYPEWLTITAVKDAAGVVAQYVATLTDITLRKEAENEVRQLAFYDPLTQLPNRRLLLNRLKQAVLLSARSRRFGALLFIDLDNFKILNDTLGHDVGDRLLQQVAQRLIACVRECDTVARLGGDEFVVMLEDLGETQKDALVYTEAVGQKILAALNHPYNLVAQVYHCTASIGATLLTAQQTSVEDLMKRADLAMYESKARGRNTLRFFDPQMQADVTARALLEAELRQGLQMQQFVLYYQCQVDASGCVQGAEALLRWQHPRFGLVSPAEFIALAEDTQLILPLGQWVLETACQQLVHWSARAETAGLSLAVNVSALQFRQADFVAQVLSALQLSGAQPGKLKIELTESLLIENMEDTITKMSALNSQGIGFALDDFGTGYSSLSYLKRLPLSWLKIDRSFVTDVTSNANDAAIARTIVALAKSLDLGVIAEGVETAAQRDLLAEIGCQTYQGYLFGRPLPLAQFEATLRLA